ncbi:nucleoside phosphorylase [Pleurocapsa sp. PCC 7319]|uniref:nucleoside phosphorylase n=1 Tax=Pleurocapsa sp. PCC 7319 TaxID=118161 RepID=UPI000345E470|nr:nucleoside phosphorylase [Pleurocapsa sp. PCC 7319]
MRLYHIGFSQSDLGVDLPQTVLLSGEPERSQYIAQTYLQNVKLLSEYRGLNSYLGYLPNGKSILVATSGMGAPSLSIVVNELVQVGIKQFIRIGTCGSIQPTVPVGSIVVSQAALCRQGAAIDIAPIEYPAVADPYLTVALMETARKLGIACHLGITASVDTFYEGQERSESSANPHLQPWLTGITATYRQLNIINYEMEVGTLFKMAGVYGFAAAGVCAVVAQRTKSETVIISDKDLAVQRAIEVAVKTLS